MRAAGNRDWYTKGGSFAGAASSIQVEDYVYLRSLRARNVSFQAISQMTGYSIDAIRNALSTLAAITPADPPEQPPPERDFIFVGAKRPGGITIATETAARYGFTFEDMKGPSRKQPLTSIRQEAMWEVRQRTKLSLPQIGHLFGGRDRTTVLNAVRRHEARLAEVREVAA